MSEKDNNQQKVSEDVTENPVTDTVVGSDVKVEADNKQSVTELKREKKKEKKEEYRQFAELEKVKSELSSEHDKFLRLAADFDNYKKRTNVEKEFLRGVVVADTVQMMLPILDNLERAIESVTEEDSPLKDGVNMILTQAREAFDKFGIVQFGECGDVFNPEIHNAVMTCDDEGLESGTLAQVLQKGYKIGDRIIRHALVKVVN